MATGVDYSVHAPCTRAEVLLGCHDTNNAVTQQTLEELPQDHSIRDIRDLEKNVPILFIVHPFVDNAPGTRRSTECTPR